MRGMESLSRSISRFIHIAQKVKSAALVASCQGVRQRITSSYLSRYKCTPVTTVASCHVNAMYVVVQSL
jgi:hypothetical protein